MRNRHVVTGFILSLLLHLLILLLFVGTMQRLLLPPPPSSPKKIMLNLRHFIPPPSPKPHRLTQSVTSPPIPKPEPKKSAKPTTPVKKLRDTKHRMLATQSPKKNNVVKTVKKIVKKTPVKRKTETKRDGIKHLKKNVRKKKRKHIVKKRKHQKKISVVHKRGTLADALMGAGTNLYPTKSKHRYRQSRAGRSIFRLYGKEFDSFTPAQKRFIRKNLDEIQRITQNTLSRNGYPEVAARTGQQGTNIVTFYLHPNGDISGLRLKRRMGYAALDQNTLQVIRLAYMYYPRPKSKTKITFYVNYSLY